MSAPHPQEEAWVGDDWSIVGKIFDYDGTTLLNLTDAICEWGLIDEMRRLVIRPTDVSTTITDPTKGQCLVVIPRSITTTLSPGRYTDAMRITVGSVRSVVWTGPILVHSLPFAIV